MEVVADDAGTYQVSRWEDLKVLKLECVPFMVPGGCNAHDNDQFSNELSNWVVAGESDIS